MKFLVMGGAQIRNAAWKEEWQRYNLALMLLVDWDTGEVTRLVEYETPPEFRANDQANIVFKSGTISGDRVYACTQTEVLVYEWPGMKLLEHISHPLFNDVHHVSPVDGQLAVVSTGLDMVLFLDDTRNVRRYVNVLGEDPWKRFSEDIDYRKIDSTKPHLSHPNFVFEMNNDIWVTRLEQRDAVSLNNPGRRIPIDVEKPHDGYVANGYVYFTTVNGMICRISTSDFHEKRIFDMNAAYRVDNPLGWCRGLHIEGDRAFVGFSSLRSTKFRENLTWIKQRLTTGRSNVRLLPARVAEYDMSSRKLVKEVCLDSHGMAAIFSVLRVPED